MVSITKMLEEAEKINRLIPKLLGGNYPDDRKTTLTLAYLDLSLDYHAGILLLMKNRLYGPALALVRVLFEAMLRAHWIVGCATPSQVDDVAEKDGFKFPKMDKLVTQVDRAFSDPKDEPLNFFRQAKASSWRAMNSYTHSGLRQIGRRFREHRVEANYEPEELSQGLKAATAAVLLTGYLLAKTTVRTEAAEMIEELFSFGEPSA